jgi:hypothetical protein
MVSLGNYIINLGKEFDAGMLSTPQVKSANRVVYNPRYLAVYFYHFYPSSFQQRQRFRRIKSGMSVPVFLGSNF